MKKNYSYLTIPLQILASLAFLYAVFWVLKDKGIDLSPDIFHVVSPGYFSAACLCFASVYATRLFRLRHWVKFSSGKNMPIPDWIDLYLKSIAFGSLTPARIGDFSRINLLNQTELPLKNRVKLVINEKMADFLYVPLGISLTSAIVGEKLGVNPVWIFMVGMMALGSGLLFSCKFVSFPFKPLVFGGLLTLMGFGLYIFGNAFIFWSVDVNLPVPDIAAIILSVGIIVNFPLSLNGIGLRESSLMAVLVYWGVPLKEIPPVLVLEFFMNIFFPVFLYLVFIPLKRLNTG